jgi:predicted nucleic acid-binding protein
METASALWVAARRGVIEPAQALDRMRSVQRLPIEFVSRPELQSHALQLALEHTLSLYDAEYIALALAEDCALVTADRKQFSIAQEHCGLGARAIWLGDV